MIRSRLLPRLQRSLPTAYFLGAARHRYRLTAKEVRIALRARSQRLPISDRPVSLGPVEFDHDAIDEARESTGFLPISFSCPIMRVDNIEKRRALSSVVPGLPHQFDEEDDYLNQYRSSQLALTYRKWGWDCFRHIEIMASGCLPIMLGAERIPRFTMALYPKALMEAACKEFVEQGPFAVDNVLHELQTFVNNHLTSRAMANYLVKMSSVDPETVLFADPSLSKGADYLSVMTLIGLKQQFQNRLQVLQEIDYIYEDYPKELCRLLYGRGFGYTRVLPTESRSRSIPMWKNGFEITVSSIRRVNPEVVVLGSLRSDFAVDWLKARQINRPFTIAVYGEDEPPSDAVRKLLRRADAAFVRELY